MATAPGAAWPPLLLAGLAYYAVLGGWPDTLLLLGFSAWRERDRLLARVGLDDAQFAAAAIALPGMAAGILFGLALFQVARLFMVAPLQSRPWTGPPARPLLLPGRTTHRRLFPAKHAFSYSYLTVGIPVGWTGTAGGMISTGVPKESGLSSWLSLRPRLKAGWFDVNAADYLQRGNAHLGLRGKLDAYLESQDVNPALFPHAYLVTAARFLGYNFNPVSFWYLYDGDMTLTAMILEVNNTFDERRMYFLPRGEADSALPLTDIADDELPPGSSAGTTPAAKLTQSWPKDFHVSPFNSRKGSYSLLARDPLQGSGGCTVDNTINLRSSKEHPKLVARLFSTGPGLDPNTMSTWSKLQFLLAWWWVGFVTFPRIVKEAALLFFGRKLHVWYRPEPLASSIGRRATAIEARLETVFREYLRHLVDQMTVNVVVKYIPSGIDVNVEPELMPSPGAKKNPKRAEQFEFKVLTPDFYARFVHYAHDFEAVFCELRENCTVAVSKPDLLPRLVHKKPLPPLKATNIWDYAYFETIRRLRRRPERIERPLTSAASQKADRQEPAVTVADIREFRISSMDGFVLMQKDARLRRTYRADVASLFLAERLAFGSTSLLGAEHFAVRAAVAWILSWSVGMWIVEMLVRA